MLQGKWEVADTARCPCDPRSGVQSFAKDKRNSGGVQTLMCYMVIQCFEADILSPTSSPLSSPSSSAPAPTTIPTEILQIAQTLLEEIYLA